MLELRPVDFLKIQHWFVDFQKKSKCLEIPEETAEILGAFYNTALVGYLIVQGYEDKSVDIIQGYLVKEARHKDLGRQYLRLLEDICRKAGYSKLRFKTTRSLSAYVNYAKQAGFRPETIIFSKEVT